MMPLLYDKGSADFTSGGYYLSDALKCEISEERNGAYEMELEYPVDTPYTIECGSIIKVKANDTSDTQLFRIYKVGKNIGGTIKYDACHISYELNGYPSSIGQAVTGTPTFILNNTLDWLGGIVLNHGYTFSSDITESKTMRITPRSVRLMLGGQEGSLLDTFGGELEFNNRNIILHSARGANRGVTIEYGKNLIDLNQEENIEEMYTHLRPYASNGSGWYVLGSLVQMTDPVAIGHTRYLCKEFTFESGEEVTFAAVNAKAAAFISSTDVKAPKINIKASFLPLSQTLEYADIKPLEQVRLCDTVTVNFAKLGISAAAKVIKTTYDALTERYKSIELGNAKPNLIDALKEAIG